VNRTTEYTAASQKASAEEQASKGKKGPTAVKNIGTNIPMQAKPILEIIAAGSVT
jgi:hypothetical protein